MFDTYPNLYTDVFKLKAEIVELKKRNLNHDGKIVSNAFGEQVQDIQMKDNNAERTIRSKKMRKQALLNFGVLDTAIKGLSPIENVKILGGSSDYLVVDVRDNEFCLGQTLNFTLNYEALLRAMASPYISKKYIVI